MPTGLQNEVSTTDMVVDTRIAHVKCFTKPCPQNVITCFHLVFYICASFANFNGHSQVCTQVQIDIFKKYTEGKLEKTMEDVDFEIVR